MLLTQASSWGVGARRVLRRLGPPGSGRGQRRLDAAANSLELAGVEETGAPLEVWPGEIHSSTSWKEFRSDKPSKRLEGLDPGTVLLYDASLYHRGTTNTSPRVRSSFYVTYCRQGTDATTLLPEYEGGRVKLQDVIEGSMAFPLVRHYKSEYSCESFLDRYDDTEPLSDKSVANVGRNDGADCASTAASIASAGEATATRHPPCAWPRMTCSVLEPGCARDAYARATSAMFRKGAGSNCGMHLLQAISEVGSWRNDSVLWTLVDRDQVLAAAPPKRRQLFEYARDIIQREVEQVLQN